MRGSWRRRQEAAARGCAVRPGSPPSLGAGESLHPFGMKLKKQVTVCGAAIFCVAVFSLYLMLDRVQHDPTRHQSGGNFPRVSSEGLG